jgi:hypothetical protein
LILITHEPEIIWQVCAETVEDVMGLLESHAEDIKTIPKIDEGSRQEAGAVRNALVRNGYVGNLLRDGESLEDLPTRSVDNIMQRWADFVTSKRRASNMELVGAFAGAQSRQLGPAWKDLMPLAMVCYKDACACACRVETGCSGLELL